MVGMMANINHTDLATLFTAHGSLSRRLSILVYIQSKQSYVESYQNMVA